MPVGDIAELSIGDVLEVEKETWPQSRNFPR